MTDTDPTTQYYLNPEAIAEIIQAVAARSYYDDETDLSVSDTTAAVLLDVIIKAPLTPIRHRLVHELATLALASRAAISNLHDAIEAEFEAEYGTDHAAAAVVPMVVPSVPVTSGNENDSQVRPDENRSQLPNPLHLLPETEARARAIVLIEIADERAHQDAKWGQQNHPDGTGRPGDVARADWAKQVTDTHAKAGTLDWRDILDEEVQEAYAETDPALLRAELLQVAAVATAWVEAIDRRDAS